MMYVFQVGGFPTYLKVIIKFECSICLPVIVKALELHAEYWRQSLNARPFNCIPLQYQKGISLLLQQQLFLILAATVYILKYWYKQNQCLLIVIMLVSVEHSAQGGNKMAV